MSDNHGFPSPDHADQAARHDAKQPAGTVRGKDRRPKSTRPMTRRTIYLSSELNALVESERKRRDLPSASALIENAIAKEVRYKPQVDEADVATELREVRLALHRLERDSAERDMLVSELTSGLARTLFVALPQPEGDELKARIEKANVLYQKFLDAVGRRVESGQTTLSQLPDPPENWQDAVHEDGDEKESSPAEAAAVMHQEEV